jgi:hypothetical protein
VYGGSVFILVAILSVRSILLAAVAETQSLILLSGFNALELLLPHSEWLRYFDR